MRNIELRVEGMHCVNCAKGVTNHLEKQGFTNVYVDFTSSKASFDINENVEIKPIIKGISQLGYKTSLLDAIQADKSKLSGIELKFLISVIFTIPLLIHMFISVPIFHNPLFQLIISLPVMSIGLYHFGKSGFNSLKTGVPNMDVLVFIGALAAFTYSFIGFIYQLGHDYLFFETAASIITIVFLGNLLEHRSVLKATSSVQELHKLQSPKAKLIKVNTEDGKEEILIVDTKSIVINDVLLINSGENIPIDGEIIWGDAEINESLLTGESLPVYKTVNNNVIGGTTLLSGNLKIRATVVGKDTVLSKIIELVQNAQRNKPPIQKLSDKISGIFVPSVVSISVLTFILSYFVFGLTFQSSLLHSIAVLVISCPCAMGLAVPTAVIVGIGKAAKNGILIKNAETLETLTKLKYLVFDKTGTLTTGNFKIKEINSFNKSEHDIKSILYSLEKYSSHPLAKSLVKEFAGIDELEFDSIDEIKGFGIVGKEIKTGNFYEAGSYAIARHLTEDNSKNIYLLENKKIIATVTLQDELKPNAKELIQFVKNKGIIPIILSGDLRSNCIVVADLLGVETYYYEMTPNRKLEIIEDLQKKGLCGMVGDGINDAPALAKSNLGISLSNATQIAIDSAEIVLLKDNLEHLIKAIEIGNDTIVNVKQNLFWAFFYNSLAIPVAAIGFLSPMIAALSMAFSDLIVIGNSIRFKYKN